MRNYWLVIFCVLLVLAIFSCSKESTSPDDNGDDGELIITENTIVVEDLNLPDPVIDGDEYTFTFTNDPPDIEVGDVIVGQTGLGYLRKVTSVQVVGSEIILDTEQAAITDVIEQCDIQNTLQFSINDRSQLNGWECNYLAKGVSLSRGGIDLDNLVLYSGSVGNAQLEATIPEGYIEFEPELIHELDIETFQIDHLLVTAEGNMQFDCDVEVTCTAPLNYEDETTIAEFTSPPFFIGIIPCFFELSFVAGFETDLDLTGIVSSGFDSEASLEYGAEYFNTTGWSQIWDKSFEFSAHPIEWGFEGNVEVTGYITPQLTLLIAGVAGPYLETEPYLNFDGEVNPPNWQWELAGGVNGNLGFEVEIYTFTLADYYTTLLTWETIIASDNGQIENLPPDPPTNPSPEDGESSVSINANLSWECSDPDDEQLTYDVYFGTDPTPDTGELISNNQSNYSYDLDELDYETTYYWKIVASDGEEETEGDIWDFTTQSEGGYGSVTDIDGNIYQTLVIGDQEWMVENLKVTHYRNGDQIPHLTDDGDWTSTTDGAYCYYNNSSVNGETYGALYNW